MVRGLQRTMEGVDEALERSEMRLFEGGTVIHGREFHEDEQVMYDTDASDDDDDSDGGDFEGEDVDEEEGDGKGMALGRGKPKGMLVEEGGRVRRRAFFEEGIASEHQGAGQGDETEDEDDSEDGDDGEGDVDDDDEDEDDVKEQEDEEEGLGAAARWKERMLTNAAAVFSNRRVDIEV